MVTSWLRRLGERPVLELTPAGVRINTPQYDNRVLAWSEISEVKVVRYGWRRCVSFKTVAPKWVTLYPLYLPLEPQALVAQILEYVDSGVPAGNPGNRKASLRD